MTQKVAVSQTKNEAIATEGVSQGENEELSQGYTEFETPVVYLSSSLTLREDSFGSRDSGVIYIPGSKGYGPYLCSTQVE